MPLINCLLVLRAELHSSFGTMAGSMGTAAANVSRRLSRNQECPARVLAASNTRPMLRGLI
jgi:hypothetical protein